MRKTWTLSVGRDGWSIHVREEPRWVRLGREVDAIESETSGTP